MNEKKTPLIKMNGQYSLLYNSFFSERSIGISSNCSNRTESTTKYN